MFVCASIGVFGQTAFIILYKRLFMVPSYLDMFAILGDVVFITQVVWVLIGKYCTPIKIITIITTTLLIYKCFAQTMNIGHRNMYYHY